MAFNFDESLNLARRATGEARRRLSTINVTKEARRAADHGSASLAAARRMAVQRKPSLLQAHEVTKGANSALDQAVQQLEDARAEAQEQLAALGQLELDLYGGVLRRFSRAFSRLKNVSLTDVESENLPPAIEAFSAGELTVDFTAIDGLKTAVLTGGSGAAAGLITFASVGTLATASTGTAIGTLSGAAATNATLAWLGGGSLAAGGMGMAGGMMVLGGLVAAPVLAVGGMILRQQGRKALATAKTDALRAQEATAQMAAATDATIAISQRASRLADVLERLGDLAAQRVAVLEFMLDDHDDYLQFSERERQHLATTVAVVKTARAVIDVPVINDAGNVTAESGDVLAASADVVAANEGR